MTIKEDGSLPSQRRLRIKNELIERIARTIYEHPGGMFPDEVEKVMGAKLRAWRLPDNPPWDQNSDTELCEWERDDFRFQAKRVLELLETEDLINYDR